MVLSLRAPDGTRSESHTCTLLVALRPTSFSSSEAQASHPPSLPLSFQKTVQKINRLVTQQSN